MSEDNLSQQNIQLLIDGLEILSIKYSDQQLSQLIDFYDLYQKTNQQMNLSRITDPSDFVIKHILDCVSGIPFFSKAAHIMDIGAGGGFPGIVLAIFLPNVTFSLIDVIAKKVVYLKQIIENLKLAHCKAYNASQEKIPHKTDLITCRALGSLEKIHSISLKYKLQNTSIVAYKATRESINKELKDLKTPSKVEVIPIKVPFLDAQRHIVLYKSSI